LVQLVREKDSGIGLQASGFGQTTSISFISFVSSEKQVCSVCTVGPLRGRDNQPTADSRQQPLRGWDSEDVLCVGCYGRNEVPE